MSKKQFYSLHGYVDSVDGNAKIGYLRYNGFDVPNEYGFDLAVYKTVKSGDANNAFKPIGVWYVVDCACGLAVGEGSSRSKAIANAMEKLGKLDEEWYQKKVRSVIDQYGYPPGKGIYFL